MKNIIKTLVQSLILLVAFIVFWFVIGIFVNLMEMLPFPVLCIIFALIVLSPFVYELIKEYKNMK